MPRFVAFFVVFSCLTIGCSLDEKSDREEVIRVAAAANLQFVFPQLDSMFTSISNAKLEVTYGASGMLTAQIKQGAPFDLFLSANKTYPQYLFEEGITKDTPTIYALGTLILWSRNEEGLHSSSGKLIVANPRTAPYGQAAEQYLRQTGEWEQWEQQLVYGENIGQVNQFLLSGAGGKGFTSKSVLLSPAFESVGVWEEVDPDLYPPIEQAMVILNTAREETETFRDFLLSPEADSIWKLNGYRLPAEHRF